MSNFRAVAPSTVTRDGDEHAAYQRLRAYDEDFIAIVSHDLRAPVRGIVNLVEWIVADLPAEHLSASVKDSLTMLTERALHLRRMIDAVTDYGRCAQLAEQTSHLSLSALVEQAVQAAQVPPGFRVELDVQAIDVVGPLQAWSRCLHEAIDNAWRHHQSESGTIWITSFLQPSGLHCTVQDDGPGCDLTRIQDFTPLFRTGSGKAAKERLGRGLAVISRLTAETGATWHVHARAETMSAPGLAFTMNWPTVVADSTGLAA